MFELTITEDGQIHLSGRLDASQAESAKKEFDKVTLSAVVNFKDLDYISSAGLGILFAAQKRLKDAGQGLKLINMNQHIRDVFRYARFDLIFEIE
jgi:Anti-anti-sigma regulatory factor (antagonist of anti-sigma factor)